MELLQTQHAGGLASVLDEVARSGHWEGELLHRRRDGTEVSVLSRWVSRRIDAGRNEILEINTDVTDRKNIERALQEKNDSLERANAKFRQLLESAPDGIVIASRDGRIVLINSQTERLFGYAREEMIGQPVECCCRRRCARGTSITGRATSTRPKCGLWARVST